MHWALLGVCDRFGLGVPRPLLDAREKSEIIEMQSCGVGGAGGAVKVGGECISLLTASKKVQP